MPSTTEVITKIEALVTARLFGDQQRWLADRETCRMIGDQLVTLGIDEIDKEDGKTIHAGPLAREMAAFGLLPYNLLDVFLGTHEPGEVPHILEEHGLLDAAAVDDLFDEFDALHWSDREVERVLRPVVQQAYRDYCSRSGRIGHA